MLEERVPPLRGKELKRVLDTMSELGSGREERKKEKGWWDDHVALGAREVP